MQGLFIGEIHTGCMKILATEAVFHRKAAVDCFNRAWDLLDKKKRSEEENLQMLHLAHTSRYHWGLVGTPKHLAVGEWQISRIYAELREPRLALLFAKSCLETCKSNGLREITNTADEAMARAYAVAKNYRRAQTHLERARKELAALTLGKEDRSIYLEQLRQTEALIPS